MKTTVTLLVFAIVLGVAPAGAPAGAAVEDDPEATPARWLEQGKRLLGQRKRKAAVQLLRRLVRGYPESSAAADGLKHLHRLGFGLHWEVAFDEKSKLIQQRLSEPDLLRRLDAAHDDMLVFFRQTFPRVPETEFQLVVHDSRARYRSRVPRATRRSHHAAVPPGPSNLDRTRIHVYYDVRFAQPQDALLFLLQDAARETARVQLRGCLRRPLPPVLEEGLSDYLAVRLHPEPLVAHGWTRERYLRGLAREGLSSLRKPEDFAEFLMGSSPAGRVAPQMHWRWVGLTYSILDLLVHGKLPAGVGDADELAADATAPRNRQLQEWLRGLDALPAGAGKGPRRRTTARRELNVAAVEALLRRHYGLDLRGLHGAWMAHVRQYGPRPVESDPVGEL